MPRNNFQLKVQNWVNREVKKELDKDPFSSLPLKMRIGIFTILGAYLIGYILTPLIVFIGGGDDKMAEGLTKGSFVYLTSWVLGIIGIFLAGKESIKYPVYFSAKLLKKLFPKYFMENNGKHNLLSLFALANILSSLLLLIFAVLSVLKPSLYWIICMGTVIAAHQALYIYGMFSEKSNYFFYTVKGKEFFDNGDDNGDGILFRFDDGPDPEYTPRILDILKAHSLKGFFAITGENAEKYPGIVKRIHEENHAIGNHTYSHPYNILLRGYKKIYEEISRTNEVLENITGETPHYFCPPMGQKNPVIGKAIKNLGMEAIMWDIRTYDTRLSTKKIVNIVRKKFKSPSIILFHDAVLPWSKQDRESTIEALKEIIAYLKGINIIR